MKKMRSPTLRVAISNLAILTSHGVILSRPSARVNGYQILLATNSKFTAGKKTVNVKGFNKSSKKVTKLKAGKKYYIKIRTYMTVGGKTYWSPWSKAKTVKVKK